MTLRRIATFVSIYLVMHMMCIGQIDSFKIKEYVYPDVIRKTLRLTPQLRLNNNNHKSSLTNSNTMLFRANASFFGSEFVNREKRQSRLSFSGNLGLRKYSDKVTPSNQSNTDGFSFYKSVGWVNRFFFKPKRFIELDGSSSIDYNSEFNYSVGKPLLLRLAVSPKIGLGRIEIVTDAWHTVTILKMLDDSGLLLKAISTEQINAIAQTISELKNYRNPDNRLETIYEYEQLCKYLIDNGYCNAENYRFFSILRDAYDFEGFILREHGHAIKAGVEADFRHYDYNSDAETNLDYQIYTLVFEYLDRNAINDKWQFDQSYSIKKGEWNVSRDNSNDYSDFNYTRFGMSHFFGYYINRRTFARAGIRSDVVNFDRGDFSDIFFTADLSYNYYLSPQTQLYLNCNYNLSDTYSIIDLENDFRSTFILLGVNHFFF